jgi:hypothetical protein
LLKKMIRGSCDFLFVNKCTAFQNLSFNGIISASGLLHGLRVLWTNTSWIRRTGMERNYIPVIRMWEADTSRTIVWIISVLLLWLISVCCGVTCYRQHDVADIKGERGEGGYCRVIAPPIGGRGYWFLSILRITIKKR